MDSLPWPLRLILSLRASIGAGSSARWALEAFLREETGEEIRTLRRWYLMKERNEEKVGQPPLPELGALQRALFDSLARGLKGESIATQLAELETEMIEVCEADIERFASSLPLFLMAILAGCAFPAMMMALIGPLVGDLLRF